MLTALLWITSWLSAQNKVDPEVLSSAGSHFQIPGLHLDYTMGEFMVQTLGTNPRFTQGFQQPGLEFIIGTIDPDYAGKIRIYPNPASEWMKVEIDEDGLFEIHLLSLQGASIVRQVFISTADVNITSLVPGLYAFTISKDGTNVYSDILEKIK